MSSPIIVGLALRDDDAAPLALARRLGRLTAAPLALATVLPREAPARFPTPEYAHDMRERAAEALRAAAGELGEGAEVSTYVLEGSRAGALHDLAEQTQAAAVVVGSTHRGAAGRLLIGDVGAGLLSGSSCPVVIAPRDFDDSRELRRIGVAYDGSAESRVALDAAIGLARRTGGSVAGFTVLEPIPWTTGFAWPASPPSPELEASRQEWAQAKAEEALEAMEAVADGITGAAEVLHGQTATALAGVSKDLDLLVCGSRGYGAARRVLAGSVARRLAHEAACPLLIVPREPSPAASALWRPLSAADA